MNLQLEQRGPVLLARVGDADIRADAAKEFQEHIRRGLANAGGGIVIDFSKVSYLDSSVLGALVALRRDCRPPGAIALFGLRSTVHRIFQLTNFDSLFHCAADEAAAIRAIESSQKSYGRVT